MSIHWLPRVDLVRLIPLGCLLVLRYSSFKLGSPKLVTSLIPGQWNDMYLTENCSFHVCQTQQNGLLQHKQFQSLSILKSSCILYPASPSEMKSRNIYQQCVPFLYHCFFFSYIITWMYFVPNVFKHLACCIWNYAVEPFQPWIFQGILSSL